MALSSRLPLARLRWGAVLAALCLGGCTLMPTYERPTAPIAPDWPLLPANPAITTDVAVVDVAAADLPWQDFIGEPALHTLIGMALQNNRDLRVAALSIEQARAQYQIRSADELPSLNLGTSGSFQSKAGSDNNSNNSSSSGSSTSTSTISRSYSAGVTLASWEIDFFGRIASLKEAALAQYLATQEARHAAQISLVAAVANTWLSLRTNDALLALTEQTLATRNDSLRLMRLRFEKGVTSALDLRQAESLAAAARAALAQQQRLRAWDVNALTLLVGQSVPMALLNTGTSGVLGASTYEVTPPPFSPLPEGLPSDLLARRPDVRQAEQQLRSANAQIGAARAAFFPRIALTASAGTASSALSGLFQSGAWGWTLAPQALLPIFDAGRNQAGLDSAHIGRDMALAQYEKSIQTAFREVADALAGRATLGEQLNAQQAQAQAEADRFTLADLRYRNGVASYLDVLDAQRALFATQQALAQTQLAQWQNQVVIYKVLGGGWIPHTPAKQGMP